MLYSAPSLVIDSYITYRNTVELYILNSFIVFPSTFNRIIHILSGRFDKNEAAAPHTAASKMALMLLLYSLQKISGYTYT